MSALRPVSSRLYHDDFMRSEEVRIEHWDYQQEA
jgi:hypothetical protein